MAALEDNANDSAVDNHLWLPGHALNCYEGSPLLRSWLLTPGLLTQRMRDTCGKRFQMNILSERNESGQHLREIELCCDGRPWVFAQTRVPAATLAAEPWLARIGQTALGEALAAHDAVRRPEFDYARLYDDVDVVRAALARRALPPQALWVRRSVFELGAHTLTLREVFLPDVGQLEPAP
jgi:chorismate--pyruvate lyase